MDLPSEIVARMPGRSFVRVSLGESGAAVWRSTMEHSVPLYLKAAISQRTSGSTAKPSVSGG